MENVGSKVSYFCVGVGIGAIVSLLVAPKSGEETREYISEKVGQSKKYVQHKADELRQRAEDIANRGKHTVAQQAESISAAIDAGREAYQRETSKTA